jgi:kynurenine formamidase
MPDQNTFRAVIDLTHNLNDRSPNWEGTAESPYESRELGNLERDGYYSRVFTTQEHYGTHLDAPAHFAAECVDGGPDSGRATGAAAGGH